MRRSSTGAAGHGRVRAPPIPSPRTAPSGGRPSRGSPRSGGTACRATGGVVIRAGSGFAHHRDPVEAGLEAALIAQEGVGLDHADACVVFATSEAYPGAHGLLHAVRRATGARAVVGCSGAGVLTERGEYEAGGAAQDGAA